MLVSCPRPPCSPRSCSRPQVREKGRRPSTARPSSSRGCRRAACSHPAAGSPPTFPAHPTASSSGSPRRAGTYSFDASALRSAVPVDETWGTLSLRRVGDTAPPLTRRVYWDATPPVARFTTPQFDARYKKNGWEIVAHSLDQDIASIVVKWSPGVPRRFTPLYEQHTLGWTLGNDGHASCAPTASMAAMDWLSTSCSTTRSRARTARRS